MIGFRFRCCQAIWSAVLLGPWVPVGAGVSFNRGDVNDDGIIDISDPVNALGYLFLGSKAPACLKAADVTDDGAIDISDPVRLLGILFLGGQAVGAPIGACGADATPDALSCGRNRCSGPPVACSDLVAASIEFERADPTRFSPDVLRVIGTIRNDGPDPFTAAPGGARVLLGQAQGDFLLPVYAEKQIAALAPGEEIKLEADLPFSFDIISVKLAIVLGGARHDPECDDANNGRSIARAPLLTGITQQGDCSPDLRRFNEDIMKYGRIAAVSRAFEECVASRMRALYVGCTGDPFSDADIETQIEKVLAVSRSVNPVNIYCSGADPRALAQAGLGSYGHSGNEEFLWSGWLAGVHDHLRREPCVPPEDPAVDDCRHTPYPWPYSQAAKVVWHEVMHTHGYGHGANSPEATRQAWINCGRASTPGWHFQWNTVPYIVGQCMEDVIRLSEERCTGGLDNCLGDNQYRIIRSFNDPSAGCQCVNDPGERGLGIITAKDSELRDLGILPEGARAGNLDHNWRYGTSDKVHGSGDFDGDGRDEILLTSSWGIGILEFDSDLLGDLWKALVSRPNGHFGEWNFDSSANTIVGVGDFNADGRADILVTSAWGIGILTRSGDTLSSLLTKPNGSRFGEWVYSSAKDKPSIGDFNGDQVDDILIARNDGVAILTYFRGNLASIVAAPNGTWFGGWNFSGTDNWIAGTGDVDGDGGDDILIRSPTWLGVLTLDGPALTSLVVEPSGTVIGSWRFDAATNLFVGAADIDGNGSEDILLRGPEGYGAFTRSGPTFVPIDTAPIGALFGSWIVQGTDWTVGLGNYDGRAGSEILLQAHDG